MLVLENVDVKPTLYISPSKIAISDIYQAKTFQNVIKATYIAILVFMYLVPYTWLKNINIIIFSIL